MDEKVVAVMHSLAQKEGVYEQLKDIGVDRDKTRIVSMDDKDADEYTAYFERGAFVVLVQSEKDIGELNMDEMTTIDDHRTPHGKDHTAHHHTRHGL